MATDDVQLPELEVIQRYSLAVRGATAPRADVVAALQADLAWLTSGGGRPAKTPGKTASKTSARAATRTPAKEALESSAQTSARPARTARRAPAKRAPRTAPRTEPGRSTTTESRAGESTAVRPTPTSEA